MLPRSSRTYKSRSLWSTGPSLSHYTPPSVWQKHRSLCAQPSGPAYWAFAGDSCSLLGTCHLHPSRDKAATALLLWGSRDLSAIPAGSLLTAGPALAKPAAAQEEAAAFCDPLSWSGSLEHFLKQLLSSDCVLAFIWPSKTGRNCLQPAGGSIFGEQARCGHSSTQESWHRPWPGGDLSRWLQRRRFSAGRQAWPSERGTEGGLRKPPLLSHVFVEFLMPDPIVEAGNTAASLTDKISDVRNLAAERETMQKLPSKLGI